VGPGACTMHYLHLLAWAEFRFWMAKNSFCYVSFIIPPFVKRKTPSDARNCSLPPVIIQVTQPFPLSIIRFLAFWILGVLKATRQSLSTSRKKWQINHFLGPLSFFVSNLPTAWIGFGKSADWFNWTSPTVWHQLDAFLTTCQRRKRTYLAIGWSTFLFLNPFDEDS
jgi:hypothetical protein